MGGKPWANRVPPRRCYQISSTTILQQTLRGSRSRERSVSGARAATGTRQEQLSSRGSTAQARRRTLKLSDTGSTAEPDYGLTERRVLAPALVLRHVTGPRRRSNSGIGERQQHGPTPCDVSSTACADTNCVSSVAESHGTQPPPPGPEDFTPQHGSPEAPVGPVSNSNVRRTRHRMGGHAHRELVHESNQTCLAHDTPRTRRRGCNRSLLASWKDGLWHESQRG